MNGTEKNICVQCGNEFETDFAAATICPDCSLKGNDFPPGTILNGYEIIQTLGHGGMGIVYLAEQKSMQRRVALKILNPSVTKDAATVEQFLNEVRNTGNIHHPNIVNAFDAGCENNTYYLAMQYINGNTLDLIIQRDGALNEIKALEIAFQIAGALTYVWGKYQIYHRDIKPGNIMLDDEGKAMLMDLGIAQQLGHENSEEESVEGSPYYMSPEQIQGKELSWSTDLYSLGATLYQMIVGVPPYEDKTIEDILHKHCLADFPEPSQRNPESTISPETVDLLKKMMEKEPKNRFASWGEFLKELSALIVLLKEFEANPVKRIQQNAIAMAEENRKQLQKKKTKAAWITFFVTFGIIAVLIGGSVYLIIKNREAAEKYLTEGDHNILKETFENYKKNPKAENEKLDKLLKNAENAAASLGVQEENSKFIKDLVQSISREKQRFETSYSEFEKFSNDYKSSKQDIEHLIQDLEKKSRISNDDCNKLKNLIKNLKSNADRQEPLFTRHQKRLKEYKSEIAVMEKKTADFDKRLKDQKKADDERNKREYERAAAEERQRALSAAEAERKRLAAQSQQIVNKEVQKQNQLEREKFERSRPAILKNPGLAVKKKTPVKVQPVKLSNGRLALPEIKKAQKTIKDEFMTAFALMQFEKAAAIKIAPEIRELKMPTHDRSVNTEMNKLLQIYKEYHEQAAATLKCWDILNDLTKGNIFKDMTVMTSVSNTTFSSAVLHIARIQNGIVYFSEQGSNPEKFIDMTMRDKKNIALTMERVRRLPIDDVRHFYFTLGLYELAYSRCPDNEQKKLEAQIKEMVKFQYTLAKKRRDFQMMNRMKRDYEGIKILKGLLR